MFKKRVFGWVAFLVYAVALPLYLLFLMLTSHYSALYERQVLASREQMTLALEQISNYYDDDRFFHAMLQKTFRHADQSPQPIAVLERQIASLRQQFSGKLRFIVWDTRGNVIDDLSDERHFRYVLRITHQVIARIYDQLRQVYYPMPELLDVVNARIGLLRGYFGQFLLEKHLALPLLDGYLGSAIRASEDPDKGLLWYQFYENFGLICFVGRDLMDNNVGPAMIADSYNDAQRSIGLGYYDLANNLLYGVDEHEALRLEAEIAAVEYSNSAVAFQRSENFLLLFRQVSPFLVVFSWQKVADHLLHIQQEANRALARILFWLAIACFIAYCASLHTGKFALSLKQKLVLLLLAANGLPLLVLVSTGYEFFDQKRNSLVTSVQQESSRLLKEFDSRFPAGRERMAASLNDFINERNARYGTEVWPEEETAALKEFVASLAPGESYLFNEEGEQLFYVGRDALASSVSFVRDFFRNILSFLNNTRVEEKSGRITMLELMSADAEIYDGVLDYAGKIKYQNYGSGSRWAYINFLGSRSEEDLWAVVIVSWDSRDLQRSFFNSYLAEINAVISPKQIVAMEMDTEIVFPEGMGPELPLRRILHRTQTRKLVSERDVSVGGKSHIVTALTGIELSEAVIAAIVPSDNVMMEVSLLFYRVLAVVVASMMFVLIIARFFAFRLLVPAARLSEGITAIAGRNFKHRIDYSSNDEFGELVDVFNETIDGMQELAIGTAVQESLLPDGKFERARLKLFARSIFMSKMGGDYYDYFELPDDRLGIFFGDVAGHGIPAAMIMSMAKAVVATSGADFAGPAAMLDTANNVFLNLKSKGWRRMMTGQCLEINCQTGHFKFANAGQCFPVIIDPETRTVKYCKALGMPLGNKMRRPYVELEGQLNPGEVMILYTDGIIEATSGSGEVFDFSRFEPLLQNSFNDDLEVFWEGIYKGYCAWAGEQDDDITFLMIRLSK